MKTKALVGPLIFHFVEPVHRVCFYYELCHFKSIVQEYNPWNFVSGHTGSGELVDNAERHGCHHIFWCYPFEREISRVANISSNQKTSEVTYIGYYARQIFTKIHRAMQLDNDGLFLGGRALKEVHKYLQLPTDVHRVMDQDLTICE